MARSLSVSSTDTVIVGNGPSALILSYILHGNIPQYSTSPPHPDNLLHAKLVGCRHLLRLDIARLTEHFEASQFGYSTQALPINVLLDTLIQPHGDTCDLEKAANVSWSFQPEKSIPHIAIGNTTSPGGQWVDNPVHASWDIGTLSYGGMLSLPGYSFAEHYRQTNGKELPAFTRPSRRQVTAYFRTYPQQVGISQAIHNGETVSGITRTGDGFYIRSHGIVCKHLVLASGVFSELILAPPTLQPLLHLPGSSAKPGSPSLPLLIVGSGFSAADVITSCRPDQKIIHIYKWAPSTSPSPLRACHQQAYPEYAGVYRRMKQAAMSKIDTARGYRPKMRRASTSAFDLSRDWESNYEGLPNSTIIDVKVEGESAMIALQTADGSFLQRRINRLEYVVGRRGSLRYLTRDLRREVCGVVATGTGSDSDSADTLSGQTLRNKVLEDLEVAPHVFAIGSLTGDSLIRFAYGSCTYAAGRIMAPALDGREQQHEVNSVPGSDRTFSEGRHAREADDAPRVMNGLEGHHGCCGSAATESNILGDALDRLKV